MSLSKRIVILSEVNGNAKGYITFFSGISGLSGEVRISPLINDAELTLCVDGNYASYEIKKGQNIFDFRFPNAKEIGGEIIALIKNSEVAIFGTTSENRAEAYRMATNIAITNNKSLNDKLEQSCDASGKDVGGQENAYSINSENKNAKALGVKTNENSEPFYKLVEEQVESLMHSNPTDETLENLVVDSKWVKIACEEDLSYSLGVIKEEGRVKYICYAIPSTSGFNPPNHLSEFCQWLPLSANENEKNGFMVMYQNAENGESLKLNF